MGGSNHSGDGVTDVNFFDTNRHDIPTGVSPAQNEVFTDWGRGQQQQQARHNPSDYVTINRGDGQTIYAEAGSTVNIYEGGQDRRVGGGRNSYMPDYDNGQRDYAQRRQSSYYRNDDSGMYPHARSENPQYRPVNANGYEVPYRQNNGGDNVGRFFGNVLNGLAMGAGFALGGRAFGGHRGYERYERPYIAPIAYDGGYNNYNGANSGSGYNYADNSAYYPQNTSYYNNNYNRAYYPPPIPAYGYGHGRHNNGNGGNFLAAALTGAVVGSAIGSTYRPNYQSYDGYS
jgi:hypothetical protein